MLLGVSLDLRSHDCDDFDWEDLKASGITHVELCFSWMNVLEGFDRIADNARRAAIRARAEGLTVWSVHIPFGEGWDPADEADAARFADHMERIFAEIAVLRPRVAVLHGCLEPVADADRAARLNWAAHTIATLGQRCRDMGVELAVEDLPRSCLGNTAAECATLIKGGTASLCFDVNHLLKESHETFWNTVGSRVVTTHLSDYDFVDERHWIPGDGLSDWETLYAHMTADGYTGPWLFETERHKGQTEGMTSFTDLTDCFRRAIRQQK